MKDFNEKEIRKTIAIMKRDHELFEVRILDGRATFSGYFKDADTLIDALKRVHTTQAAQVYLVLNEINKALEARQQYGHFLKNVPTTSDKDVVGYQWIIIDLDPERPSGTSSTDEQIKSAQDVGRRIYRYLKQQGYEEPIVALSGNGLHLLYHVQLANSQDNRNLVKNFLICLDMLFSTDEIKVDTSVYNPARICKLYGTYARKGRDTAERPHRLARLRSIPAVLKATDKSYVQKVVDQLPKQEKPQIYNSYSPKSFDVEAFLTKYGLSYKVKEGNGFTRYILDECPFDSSHKSPDAAVLVLPNGAISFKCFHDSCSGKTWQDLRLKYEPTAYERREQEQQKKMYSGRNRFNNQSKPIMKDERGEIFRNFSMIAEEEKIKTETGTVAEKEYIPTGVTKIDQAIYGLEKGKISVITGTNGSGKSTWLAQLAIISAKNGYNVLMYSGEMDAGDIRLWMGRQIAGKNGVLKIPGYDNKYVVSEDDMKLIDQWAGDKIWIYNNDYGHEIMPLLDEITKKATETKADLVLIDNLMALDITNLNPQNQLDAQTQFVIKLAEIARMLNAHIAFVAHPRKIDTFLRLEDVSGSGNLSNRVDNAFLLHRNSETFRHGLEDYFKGKAPQGVLEGTNAIEVAKNRGEGVKDLFVPLWYETESKRLKNSKDENIIIDWRGEIKNPIYKDIIDGGEIAF